LLLPDSCGILLGREIVWKIGKKLGFTMYRIIKNQQPVIEFPVVIPT